MQFILGNKKYTTEADIKQETFEHVIIRGLNLEVSDLINWFGATQFFDAQGKIFHAELKIENLK